MCQDQKLSRVFTIRNKLGFHARPAALLVKTANQYQAEIKIIHSNTEIDGKNILGLMTLAANQGSRMTFIARGSDANEALKAIEQLFEDNFGEK